MEGLKRRAKTIVQLKPRNPATAIKGKQPIQAVCDFKQMEVCGSAFSIRLFLQYSPNFDCFMLTENGNLLVPPQIIVHRGDECALLNNSQPFKWRVLNDKGSEATVPSICFLVPPTNKDAVNSVAG